MYEYKELYLEARIGITVIMHLTVMVLNHHTFSSIQVKKIYFSYLDNTYFLFFYKNPDNRSVCIVCMGKSTPRFRHSTLFTSIQTFLSTFLT